MKINNYLKPFLLSAIIAGTLSSCVKDDDWSTPEILCNNKFDAPTTTMAEFALLAPLPASASQYSGVPYTVPVNGDPVIFDGYVVSSDENGNFYKTISFQDKPENPTIGFQIEVDKSSNYGDFPVGAHIRIKANGLRLAWDRGTLRMGSVDPTYSIGRIPSVLFNRYVSGVCNSNNRMDIVNIVPTKLEKISDATNVKYINTLVQVDDVQFAAGSTVPTPTFITYLAGAGQDTDRAIVDKFAGTTPIRSSGFSTYGAQPIPTKSGSATFVVSKYNANYQMIIRGLKDLDMNNPRFATGIVGGTNINYLGNFKVDFESYVVDFAAFPEYINYSVDGNRYWQIKTFSNNKYIQMSANGGNAGNYTTLFMVPVDFTAANKIAFDVNVGYYNGDVLKVYTTTDYEPGKDISTATLTDITSSFTIPTMPTSAYGNFGPAGSHNIPSTLTGNGFIVFEYKGVNPGLTTTIQLDNIVVN